MAKKALLIGVSQYEAGLPPLAAAPKDVAAMLRVLQSPELGAFDEVKTLIDPDLEAMQTAIDLLFQSCQKGDLGLLYFSGHGITDDSDRLYLATRRTSKDTFRSTAVSASFIDGIMHDHHHQRQLVLILDCCYAGAFTGVWHSKGIINLKSQFKIEEGRVFMVSCGSLEKSYEDKEGELSLYTKYLVQGIESSEADKDQDGFISADELHDHVKKLVKSSKDMNPEIHSFKHGNKIFISKARKVEIAIENKVPDLDRKRFRNLERYKTVIIIIVVILVLSSGFYLWQNPKLLSFLSFSILPSSLGDLPINDAKAAALYAQAEEKHTKKDYKGAISNYNEAIRLKPNYAEAYSNRGMAKFLLKDNQGAILDLNEAIRFKSEPNNAGDYFGRGNVKTVIGDRQGAIADFNEAIRIYPYFPEVYFSRGLAKFNLGDNQGAINDYNEAIRIKPDFYLAFNNRGNAKVQLGDNQGALSDFSETTRIKPDFDLAFNNRGNVKYELGDKQGAVYDYSEAIRLKPDYAEAYHGRGIAKYALGDKQGAIADYNEAIRIKPDYAEAYYSRGNTKRALGDKQGILSDYDEAIRLKADYAEAYSNRGGVKFNLGDRKGGIADFNEAIRLKPDYADAYNNRGFAKSELGDKQGALADINKAIIFKPDFARAYINRANVKYELGDKQGTRIDLQKAAELFKQQGDVENYNSLTKEIERFSW